VAVSGGPLTNSTPRAAVPYLLGKSEEKLACVATRRRPLGAAEFVSLPDAPRNCQSIG